MEKIKILVVEPEKLPFEKKIPKKLEEYQRVVGGYIECVTLNNSDSVILICNEEGKINKLPFNRDVGHDIIAGTFFIAGDDYENGDFISLTDDQIKKYKGIFNEKSIKDTHEKVAEIILRKNKIEIIEI
jgi:hypothetical protein